MCNIFARSYTTPPTMVIHVMSAVCVLLQELTDWNSVKLLMSDYSSLMKRLSSFDKDHVSDKVCLYVTYSISIPFSCMCITGFIQAKEVHTGGKLYPW